MALSPPRAARVEAIQPNVTTDSSTLPHVAEARRAAPGLGVAYGRVRRGDRRLARPAADHQEMRPILIPLAIACAALTTSSFALMLAKWYFTVRCEIPKMQPISQ